MHFPAVLSNYNGMTAYICRRFIPTTAFLVLIIIFLLSKRFRNDNKTAIKESTTSCKTGVQQKFALSLTGQIPYLGL